MKKGRKNCDEQLIEQISNTLEMLLEKGLLYTYNELKREHLDKNTIRLSWNNHLSGSFNSGDNFLKLEQYKQIINNQYYRHNNMWENCIQVCDIFFRFCSCKSFLPSI